VTRKTIAWLDSFLPSYLRGYQQDIKEDLNAGDGLIARSDYRDG
jgi:hypothetical protein